MYQSKRILSPAGMPIEDGVLKTVRDMLRAAANQMRSQPGQQCPLDVQLDSMPQNGDTRSFGIGFVWNVHTNVVACSLFDIKPTDVSEGRGS